MKTSRRTGRKIGLFGGSFNPAHEGHLHVAQTALKSLDLDEIWWLVSPQNPLKPQQPSYSSRAETVRALPLLRQMKLSRLEVDHKTQYTFEMVRNARKLHPNTRFVFLMGADNFVQFPKWKNWRDIISAMPIAIIARPTKSGEPHFKARLGKAARMYRGARLSEAQAHILAARKAPAWTYVTAPMNRQSSSAIRHQKDSQSA